LTSTSAASTVTSKTVNLTVSMPVITMGFTRSPSTASAPFTSSFTNTTTITGNGKLNYTWLFGDGTTSTLTNPTHGFETGSKTITLQATGSYNTASSTTLMVSGSLPTLTPAWTEVNPTGVAPITTSFLNTSLLNNDTSPTTYQWLFGDGTTSSLAQPTHSYETGSFSVTLNATGSYNVANTLTHTNIISASVPSVIANYTSVASPSGSVPLSVTFTNTTTFVSSSTNPGTYTYNWYFGSGSKTVSTSSQARVTASYTDGGEYSVMLQVTGSAYSLVNRSSISQSFVSASIP